MPSRRDFDPASVSPLTVNRLSIYLRCTEQLVRQGVVTISSAELAERFHLNSAQIRKDLAYFGEFGTRGVGYDVETLRRELIDILGLGEKRNVLVVGAGNLGTALVHSAGFTTGGFRVVALLDTDAERIGERVSEEIVVEDARGLDAVVEQRKVTIGVITVPALSAQRVCDELVAAGIRAILNFAPAQVAVRDGVFLESVDLKIHLEELSYHLHHAGDQTPGGNGDGVRDTAAPGDAVR